jgi:DnaJ-domain-containing protein 1
LENGGWVVAVTDYFGLLNETRRPWLEPEALHQKFLVLSASIHPDRVHHLGEAERAAAQERYVELNAAYRCLREPKERLRHLLELELGALPKEIQRVPPDLMDGFVEISQACREADAVRSEKLKTTSPLLQVQCFERAHAQRDKLLELQRKVNVRRESLLAELGKIDAAWPPADTRESPQRAGLLSRMEELYRLFSYYDRWLAQLRERVVQLSF